MNVIELERSLRQLRLGGMAAVLETRLHQAQTEPMAPIDFLACLVSDELTKRAFQAFAAADDEFALDQDFDDLGPGGGRAEAGFLHCI